MMVISSLYIIHTPYAPPASARFSAMGGARKEAAHTHTRYTRLLDVHRITFFFGKNRVVIYFPPHLVVFETPGKTPSTGTSREKKKRRETPPPSFPPSSVVLVTAAGARQSLHTSVHGQPGARTTSDHHDVPHHVPQWNNAPQWFTARLPSSPIPPFPPFPPFLTRQ